MLARRLRTTVALSADLLEAMDVLVREGEAGSRSDFLERALRRELAASRRAAIDTELAQMATDAAYQAEAVQITEEFTEADWEAWRTTERSS